MGFPKIVPKGVNLYEYYNFVNPKAKKEINMIDINQNDPYFSYFRFIDVNKILPSNDELCPYDGSCHEENQVLMQLKLKQDSNTEKMKVKNFF